MTEARQRYIDSDGAYDLIMAIVQQAKFDLRKTQPFTQERREVERFFRSSYFASLTGLNGRAILKKLTRRQGGAKK